MKKIFTIIFAALFTLPALAATQSDTPSTAEKTITGQVIDSVTEAPVEFAAVYALGTDKGISADIDGNFSLTVPDSVSQIKISRTGYEEQIFDVPANNNMDKIKLTESKTELDDVVMIGCMPKSGDNSKSQARDIVGQKCHPITCVSDRYKLTNPRSVQSRKDRQEVCIGSADEDGPCEDFCKVTDKCETIIVGDECEDQVGKECVSGDTNATESEYKWENEQLVCYVTRCADGYRPSSDQRSCIRPTLTEEESQKKIDELQKNADAMREKEQSTANRLLGGLSIGATGIGGMQLASAVAENRADDAAERDMAAYLATFRCDYGAGRNIAGGETDVQLPGGNTLFQLRQEFATLSTDVKTRKEALGLAPGIESEVVMDSATMGLYDDVSLGRTDGAYTSLSRALSDSTGADAAEWAQQRADTSSQLKTGAIVAGVGIVGGVVGDLLINRNAPKESSDEINTKYDALERLRDETEKLPNSESGAQCPSGSTGTFPNCVCTDKNYVHSANDNTCQRCPGTKVANENGTACVCPDGTAPGENDTCNTISATVTVQCDQTDPNVKVDTSTGACSCMNGYRMVNNKCTCPSDKYEINENGLCVEIQVTVVQNTPAPTPTPPERQVLPSSNLFDLGKADLRSDAMLKIGDFAGQVKSTQGTDTNYCITVVGHTDRSGTDKINIPLSQNRAKAVGNALVQAGLPTDNIRTSGVGSTECDTPDTKPNEACRKVVISFSPNKCQ